MSARHALLFSALVAVLVPYYCLVDRPLARIETIDTVPPLLLHANDIDAVTVTTGIERVRFEKSSGDAYKLVEPRDKFVPQGLMQAIVALLLHARSVEVVAINPGDLTEFGLDRPRAEIAIETGSGSAPVEILLGDENPGATAIYARIRGGSQVFLIGKDLEYYRILLFQWVEGKQGRNS